MMKLFYLFLLFCLVGCADRYSLDKGRGPDPQGIITNNPLILPPDYLLRAPEPSAKTEKQNDTLEQKQIEETVKNETNSSSSPSIPTPAEE